MNFFENVNTLEYDKYYKGHSNFSELLYREGKLTNNSHVLEIGVGTGNESLSLLKLMNKKSIKIKLYGIDKSKTMLDICKWKLGKNIKLIKADAEKKLPLNEKFNLIYLAFVYHLINNKERLFKECYRLLKDNGTLIIFTSSYTDLKQHVLNKYFPSKFLEDSKRYLSELQIRELFKKTGFKNFRKEILLRDINTKIDNIFLEGIKKGISNSVIQIIKRKHPSEFERGIDLINKDIHKGKIFSIYKTVYIVNKVID